MGPPFALSASPRQGPKRKADPRRYLTSMRRLLPLSLLLLIASALVPTSAVAASAFFDGNSADGEVAAFTTSDQLVPGDTDQESDVYVSAVDSILGEPVTRDVSI